MKIIYESDNITSLYAPISLNATIKGIGIRISGTNDTGLTLDVKDVGRIEVIRQGVTIVSIDYDMLINLGDVLVGHSRKDSATASTVDLYGYIPFRYLDDNVLSIRPSDNMQVRCTFSSGLDTALASGKVQVGLDLEYGVQKYVMHINQISETIGGSGTRPLSFDSNPNLLFCMVGNRSSGALTSMVAGTSNISKITWDINDLSQGGDADFLLDQTFLENELEVDTMDEAIVLYHAKGDITSRLADVLNVEFTATGACQPEVLLMSAEFDNDRLTDLAREQNARLGKMIQKRSEVAGSHAKNTVAVVSRLTGAKKNV